VSRWRSTLRLRPFKGVRTQQWCRNHFAADNHAASYTHDALDNHPADNHAASYTHDALDNHAASYTHDALDNHAADNHAASYTHDALDNHAASYAHDALDTFDDDDASNDQTPGSTARELEELPLWHSAREARFGASMDPGLADQPETEQKQPLDRGPASYGRWSSELSDGSLPQVVGTRGVGCLVARRKNASADENRHCRTRAALRQRHRRPTRVVYRRTTLRRRRSQRRGRPRALDTQRIQATSPRRQRKNRKQRTGAPRDQTPLGVGSGLAWGPARRGTI
jgi:hypothetical protein